MKIREIYEAVLSGKMELDYNGHEESFYTKIRMKDRYEDDVASSEGSHDGKWNSQPNETQTTEEINARMRNFYKQRLDYNFENGEIIRYGSLPDMECSSCGKRLWWKLQDDKLVLDGIFNGKINKYGNYIAEGKRCDFENKKFLSNSINIGSPIIFANFFCFEDCSKDNEGYWNLNYLSDREKITHYKAENQNIAYGQMGNMSVGIYLSKDSKTIIVSSPYLQDYLEDGLDNIEEIKNILDNYEYKGSICLEMWRWEASDLNTISQKTVDKLKKERNMDIVMFDVPHGVWNFEHYYYVKNDDSLIYSKFKLHE